jgi:hypothetical protein
MNNSGDRHGLVAAVAVLFLSQKQMRSPLVRLSQPLSFAKWRSFRSFHFDDRLLQQLGEPKALDESHLLISSTDNKSSPIGPFGGEAEVPC